MAANGALVDEKNAVGSRRVDVVVKVRPYVCLHGITVKTIAT